MTHFGKIAAAALIVISAGSGTAYADACSGHSHTNGTVLGAVGGGLIGGLASHNVGIGLGSAVVGGLAGNAIARSSDCNHRVARTAYYVDRHGYRHYYRR